MKSGGDDTRKLAENAGKQADRTKDLADRMKEQADQTKIIADQAAVQAKAAKVSADAAKSAANTAAGSLEIQKSSTAESSKQAGQVITNLDRVAASMEGTLKQSALSFEASAKQADASLKASIAASQIAARAWLFANGAIVGFVPDDQVPGSLLGPTLEPAKTFVANKRLAVRVELTNIGQTPAIEARSKGYGSIRPTGSRPENIIAATDFVFRFAMTTPFGERNTVGPHHQSTFVISGDRALTPLEVSRVTKGDAALIYAGLIEYRDIFGPTIHESEFCFMFTGPSAIGFTYCANHSGMK